MIHFRKPLFETIGAVIAGSALGVLSLRTRSILGGFLIHVAVAISMDVAAILMRT
jgi:membrane protease YdiL (CAAX protease family)